MGGFETYDQSFNDENPGPDSLMAMLSNLRQASRKQSYNQSFSPKAPAEVD